MVQDLMSEHQLDKVLMWTYAKLYYQQEHGLLIVLAGTQLEVTPLSGGAVTRAVILVIINLDFLFSVKQKSRKP